MTRNPAPSALCASVGDSRLPARLREMHFFMRLAREWDQRFEKLFRIGRLSKWYSSVGNEGVTVPTASILEAGDALVSLHRDSGAILRYYLDTQQIAPPGLPFVERAAPRGNARELLHRLACQMLGKRDGFSAGYERSYHYGHIREEDGFVHMGMISHLGAMIPVAAGMALALRQRGTDRVAVNFIGEGGTSTGDFHETLNIAAVWKLPFILIIENNQYAFSTPIREQYACDSLAIRGAAYGMPGVQVDGNDAVAVHRVMSDAVDRARRGAGPTLVEAMVGRLRGHSEGDDSMLQVPDEELSRYQARDPLRVIESRLIAESLADQPELDRIAQYCADLMVEVVDRAQAAPEPDPNEGHRSVYAG